MTPATFDDSKNGMGLDNNGEDTLSCISDKLATCDWKTGSLKREITSGQVGFDNYDAQDSTQTCDRWFTQHADGGPDTTHQCYEKSAFIAVSIAISTASVASAVLLRPDVFSCACACHY